MNAPPSAPPSSLPPQAPAARTADEARLFQVLLARSFRRGDFVLASGARSSVYVDTRLTTLSPEGMVLAGRALLARYRALWDALAATGRVQGAGVRAVAGPSVGADPLVLSLCHAAQAQAEPLFGLLVRKAAKAHGRGKRIEGLDNLSPGDPVLLIEDVVTSGGSSLEALDALEAAGLRVVAALALVDREAGGAQAFAQRGLPFQALFRLADFLTATEGAEPESTGEGAP